MGKGLQGLRVSAPGSAMPGRVWYKGPQQAQAEQKALRGTPTTAQRFVISRPSTAAGPACLRPTADALCAVHAACRMAPAYTSMAFFAAG